MIKGASGKQQVQAKGIATHNISGKVGAGLKMKGQTESISLKSDSCMNSMSMNKNSLKGEC